MNPDVDQVLDWVGFAPVAQRARIADEAGLLELRSFDTLDKTGVSTLADSLRRITPAAQRVHISKGKQDMLIDVSNWVGDFIRCSLAPELPDDQQDFEDALLLARGRAEARQHMKDQESTLSEAAKPSKLKDEKSWPDFEDELHNYLCTILGVKSVPLAYVKRLEAAPDHVTQWEDDQFNEQMIACAPLTGPAFKQDALAFHLILWKLIEREDFLSLIQPLKRRQNGRLDYLALREYMMGPGNVSRRVGAAEAKRRNLRYKNERAMQFATFVSKLRSCYTTLETEGRPVAAPAQVDDLLKKIEAPYLAAQKANLEARHAEGNMTFDRAVNVFASTVANNKDATSFSRLSSTETKPKTKLRRLRGGGIDTEYTYSKSAFYGLSKEDMKALKEAREAKPSKDDGTKREAAQITVAELVSQAVREAISAKDDEGSEKPAAKKSDDAGKSFGGRAEKKQKHGS